MEPGRSGIERMKSDGVRKVGCREDRSLKGCTEHTMREARDEGGVGRVEAEVKRSGGMGK